MNQVKAVNWIGLFIISIMAFAAMYLSFDASNNISMLQKEIDDLRQQEEKVEFWIENSKPDTVIVNINNKYNFKISQQ